ncbi:MAG: FAD-binding protein [Chloroflexi bacterium]|nr:FAD-binding protein [Chloroflexota bacterium]
MPELYQSIMENDYQIFESDVLVVGAGMAGLSAAIRARDLGGKVVLVEKGKIARSSVSMFCHAYGAPVSESIFDPLLKELVERSGYMADQSWFEILLNEISSRVSDMERWGVLFEKDADGKLKLDGIRGQKIKWCALAQGKQVIEALRQTALTKGVQFVERVSVVDLLTSDGRHPTQGYVTGALGIGTRTGQIFLFKSKAVVITSGSISAKHRVSYMDNVTGDGYAIAFRAGAEIGGMEFSPNFRFGNWNRRFSTGGQGQFQHDGARLVNRLGQEFLHKYPDASRESIGFESQDEFGDLCRAMAIEVIGGRGPVYFDLRAWSQQKIDKMRKVLPFTMMAFEEAGVKIKEQPIETTPMVSNYGTGCQSGIRINTSGESTIECLYAAGAAAMYGQGPLPQALSVVGGYRAGENACRRAKDSACFDINWEQAELLAQSARAPLFREQGISPDQIYYSVNEVVTSFGASLFKHQRRIEDTLVRINQLADNDLPRMKADNIHQLIKANEAANFVLLMKLVNMAALERKESRMSHYREDYPYTDNQTWLKWLLLKANGAGKIQLKTEPIPLGSHDIQPESLTRKPSPIQFRMEKS